MQRQHLLFIVIFVFSYIILRLVGKMSEDKNAAIRFLGYFIAIVTAFGVLWLVLYLYFDINLLYLAL